MTNLYLYNPDKHHKITLNIIFIFLLILCIPSISFAEEKTIKIIPGDEADTINMRYEVTLMMEDLGYKWHPVLNESTGEYLKVAEKFGQYRMLFELKTSPSIQVRVHFRETDNVTGIHFTESGTTKFTDFAKQQYQTLITRIKHEFGTEHVTENSFSIFTP